MKQLKSFLESMNIKIFVGKSNYRACEEGQVLGCDVTGPLAIKNSIDCFVFLGSGLFHQLNLAIQTSKPIIQANPLTEEITELKKEEVERYKKLKADAVVKVKHAKKIGILISTKPGQQNLKLAEKVKEKLEKEGKKVYMFMFETLVPEELYNFSDIEAWVNTACQRIAIDDIERFPKPVANAEDIF
jgi:2-(3-amino-3-carboxypropyl)histidine synthase